MRTDSLAGVRVLVTGGAGFIGSEVTKQLLGKHAKVSVLDNFTSGKIEYLKGLKIELIRGDICNSKSVSAALQDKENIVHLAALPFIPDSYVHPEEFFRVNTLGTIKLLWTAIQSESAIKFVHVSTSEVYGTAKYVPMDENHPTFPHSTYASSKLAGENAIFTLHKEHGFPVVILRPFNSYGPRATQPYVIPEIILQLFRGSTVYLGNTDSIRDFTYVSDTARAIVRACVEKKAIGNIINIGSGNAVKIRDLVYKIAGLLGHLDQVKIKRDETRFRPYDVDRLVCDYSKARRMLGWKPKISLNRGLIKTLQWMKMNPLYFKEPFRGWPVAMRKPDKIATR